MKIAITGAAGFLGLHLAGRFFNKSNELALCDIQPFDKKEYPKSKFIKGDVRDRRDMDLFTKDQDILIHAAAALPLWKERDIFEVNVNGTKNLLENCLKNKVSHFIYISSTAVYGVPKKHPVYETDPLVGVGAYGESKIQAEKLCEEYRKKGLLVTVIRPKTFIGTHRLGVFEILFDWIKDGKKIPVIGSGNNRYQLLDVDDLTEAIFRIANFKDKKKINTVFNIGAKNFNSVKEDLIKLFEYANSGSKILSTPAMPIKAALFILEKLKLSPLYKWIYATADKDSYVSIKRLTDTLKWVPKYSNAQSLIKSYKWYINNYKEIKSRPAGTTHTVGWKQGILRIFKKFL
ncbi:MAG: NAD(P)-dependent oxidoreductase [Patescibacteria group bacterium]